MTPEQKSSEPHSFIFIANQMCRECFDYDIFLTFLLTNKLLKYWQYCQANELGIRTETVQSWGNSWNLSLLALVFRMEAAYKTWETQNLRNVASVDCHEFQNNNFSYNWLRLSITQSCPYKLPIRQRIAVFWRSSNSQQFGGGNSRRSIIMSIWLYMSICEYMSCMYEWLWNIMNEYSMLASVVLLNLPILWFPRPSSRRDRRGCSAAKGQLATCAYLHKWVKTLRCSKPSKFHFQSNCHLHCISFENITKQR